MRIRIFLIFCFVQFCTPPVQLSATTKPVLIDIIDVGDGDSILIQNPEGKAVLIDSGNLLSGFDVIKHVKSQSLELLDALFLTHPHLDHIGGTFGLLKLLKVERIYDNGETLNGRGVQQDINSSYIQLVRNNPNYSTSVQGAEYRFADLKVKVLWPPEEKLSEDWNSNSLVLLLEYGNFKALLMGDANKTTEKALIKASLLPGKIQVLKAGHHGAKDTATKSFLKQINPKTTLISSSKNSPRAYPDPLVIEKYSRLGSVVFRTDKGGTIRVEAFPSGSFHIIQGKQKSIF